MSKRKLKFLVIHGHVSGWDDPRLCTLNGLRRRGYSGATVNRFCEAIGVTRAAMTAKNELLEQLARQDLDTRASRRFAVLKPLKVILEGLPEGGKSFEMKNHPSNDSFGTRQLTLTSTIYIESDDFRPDLGDDPKFFGLAPGREAGLLGAGVNITITDVVKDTAGGITHLVAAVDMTRARKVKGHLHWVSADTAVEAECRLYGVLFTPEDPEAAAKEAAAVDDATADGAEDEDEDEVAAADGKVAPPPWLKLLNPHSLSIERALVEGCLAQAASKPDYRKDRPAYQFQRVGFFCVDDTSTVKAPVFNRVVALKEDKERKGL